MKSYLWALLSVLVVSAQAAGPNLLRNPSFETPDWMHASRVEFWQNRPNMMFDTNVTHSGKAALRIEGRAASSAPYSIQGGLHLLPDTAYTLSGWVRTTPLAGGGVTVVFAQRRPASVQLAKLETVTNAPDWQLLQRAFRTPTNHQSGDMRIEWNLNAGDVAWLDDLCLTPDNGRQATVALPVLSPAGGIFTGPVHVAVSSAQPDSDVRYTVDGSEPALFSTRYETPFLLSGAARVRAKAFCHGQIPSATAAADFVLKPDFSGSVDFYPVGWDQDVDAWWAGHIWNPSSPNYRTNLARSPEPRINVADVRDRHRDSDTAGIREALAELPAAGGTLFFPSNRGPYIITRPAQTLTNYYTFSGSILVTRRSNIHFVSDGAILRSAGQSKGCLFGFSSMEFPEHHNLQNPSRNFYFKGLVFDGGGQASAAMIFRHVCDVVFEDCIFQNFNSRNPHGAVLNATSMSDNHLLRRCTFRGPSGRAVYWDGLHGGAMVNCEFGPGFDDTLFVIYANNDMAPFSAFARTCQYLVLDGCRFIGPGREVLGFTSANTLIRNCRTVGTFRHFARFHGRGKSNITPYLRYDGGGIRVIGNEVDINGTFVEFTGDSSQHTRLDRQQMVNIVASNRVRGADVALRMDPGVSRDPLSEYVGGSAYHQVGPVFFRNNTVSGPERPVIMLERQALDRIAPVTIENNTLVGKARALVVDLNKQPLTNAAVTLQGNRLLDAE